MNAGAARGVGRGLLVFAAVAGLYLAAAWLGLRFATSAGQVAALWPPAGIAVAALVLLRRDRRAVLAGVFSACAAANLAGGHGWAVSLAFAGVNTLEAWGAGLLLVRLAGADLGFHRLADVGWLLVLLVTWLPGSAALGALVPALAYGAVYPAAWLSWWIADATAVAVFVPLLVTGARVGRDSLEARRLVEHLANFLVVSALCLLLFAANTAAVFHPIASVAPFPFLFWAAARLGPHAAAISAAIFSAAAVVATVAGTGVFAGHGTDPRLALLNVQLYVVVLVAAALVPAALLRERRQHLAREASGAARLRAVLDAVPDLLFVLDRDGVFQGEPAGDVTLRFPGSPACAGRRVGGVLPAAPAERLAALAARTAADGTRQPFELELEYPDGRRRFEGVTAALPGPEPHVLFFARDMTAGRVMERALRASEERLRAFVDQAGDGVAVLDARRRVVEWNLEMERLTGVPRAAALGRSAAEVAAGSGLFPGRDRQRPDGLLPGLRPGEKALTGAFQVPSPAGPRHVESTTFAFDTQQGIFYGQFLRDVTDLRRAEQEAVARLADVEAVYGVAERLVAARDVAEAARIVGDAVFLLEPRSYVAVSGLDGTSDAIAIYQYAGFGRRLPRVARLVGVDPHTLRLPRAEFTPELLATFVSGALTRYPEGVFSLLGGQVSRRLCAVAERLFGIIEVWSAGFAWEGRHYGGISVLVRRGQTIRHARAIEALARLGSVAMRRLHEEATRRGLEAQLRHEQKLSAVGMLANGVAHEINNPLMGMINLAQLIVDRLPPEGADDGPAGFAREIIAEGERVARITRGLLAFSRQDFQAPAAVAPAGLVDGILGLSGTLLAKRGIRVEVDVPDGLPAVRCAAGQIQQVLLNLLTNAGDALDERWPDWHADKELRVTGRVPADDEGAWVRISVADRGNGIPAAAAARIFEPFFTTKPRERGTGLGLAISYGIVKEQGGRLTFETVAGQGTVFHLDLPAVGS